MEAKKKDSKTGKKSIDQIGKQAQKPKLKWIFILMRELQK